MKTLSRALLLSLVALPLAADPIAEVRAALERLTAREPIRVTYEMQRTVANEGKFDNDKFTGKASVDLEGDANGMRVVFSRALLEQVGREQDARRKNADQSTPTVSALREIDPVETADAIDFAPTLLRLLDGAKLVSDAQATWGGKPARAMVIRVADRIDKENKSRVKVAENRLTLWLGPDLVPLAAEHLLNAKFSLLIFKGESKQKKSWHLARVADRLVRVRHEATSTNSGMGQKGNEQVVATVRVH
ncbi:MAG TPA: hypothetical protein VEK57_08525 [Thermoanaerobaculia bacterium]|nr:hypothetical protein [Thermoanaerobaculia bacterium]